jgi:hypothetical protein
LAALSIAIQFEAEKALNLLVPLLFDAGCLMEIPNLIQVSKEKDELKFAVLKFKNNTPIGHIVFIGGAPFYKSSQSDYNKMVKTFSLKPTKHQHISSIFQALCNPVPREFKFNLAAKDLILEFIASSEDSLWIWSKSNPEAIHFFSNDSEILEAVWKKLKLILHETGEFELFCRQSNFESIIKDLSVEPYRHDNFSLILDLLNFIVPKTKLSTEAKDNMMQFIISSQDDQWMWMKSNLVAIIYFTLDGEVLAAVLEKALKKHEIPLSKLDSIFQENENGNSTLHCLSSDPLCENQMNLIMFILSQKDVQPEAKNNDGHSFLDLSPIFSKLVQSILTAPDDWAKNLFNACAEKDSEVLARWIRIGDDDVLESFFKRMRQSTKKTVLN